MAKKLRPMGAITQDMEKLLEEMTDPKGHDLQWGEVKALVDRWLEVHADHAREEYLDGTHPENYYGPRRTK
jgi:hypothetical protein